MRTSCIGLKKRCKLISLWIVKWLAIILLCIVTGFIFYGIGFILPILPEKYFEHDYQQIEHYTVSGLVFVVLVVAMLWSMLTVLKCLVDCCSSCFPRPGKKKQEDQVMMGFNLQNDSIV